MKNTSISLLALAGSLCLTLLAQAATPVYKNLQVLPKDTDKPTLKAIMKKQSRALGVECEYCHNQPNMDEETKAKAISREMMRLTDQLNAGEVPAPPKGASKDLVKAVDYAKKYMKGKKDISCMTCHNGKEKPAKPA